MIWYDMEQYGMIWYLIDSQLLKLFANNFSLEKSEERCGTSKQNVSSASSSGSEILGQFKPCLLINRSFQGMFCKNKINDAK